MMGDKEFIATLPGAKPDISVIQKLAADRLLLSRWPAVAEQAYQQSQRAKYRISRAIVFLVVGLSFLLGPSLGTQLFQITPEFFQPVAAGTVGLGSLLLVASALLVFRPWASSTFWLQYVGAIAVTVAALWLQFLSSQGRMTYTPLVFVSAVLPIVIFCGYPARQLMVGAGLAFTASVSIELFSQQAQSSHPIRIYGLINVAVICVAAAATIEYLNRLAWINFTLAKLLGSTDPLTGLATRADFNRTIVSRLRLARRDQKTLAVMLLDIDHFKQVNDMHGHLVGDSVLRSVGALLRRGFADRPNDLKVRFGGEEVLMLWYDTAPEKLAGKVERVLQAIRDMRIEHAGEPYALSLTASAGVIYGIPGDGVDYLQLLGQADALLYRAKHDGRNRAYVELIQ